MTGLLHSSARNPPHFYYSERKNLNSWTAEQNQGHSAGADDEITEGLKQQLSRSAQPLRALAVSPRVLGVRGIRVLFPALK